MNQKRIRRLYNEMGLQLRNKTPKRRVKAKLCDDRAEATHTNQVWAMRCPAGVCLANTERALCAR